MSRGNGWRSRRRQRYAGGYVECGAGQNAGPVIVTRGVGVSILPVRYGAPPEVGVVELVGG